MSAFIGVAGSAVACARNERGNAQISVSGARARKDGELCASVTVLAAAAAAAAAAVIVLGGATSTYAKSSGILSTNTLFRRYIVTDSDAILRYALPLPAERRGETTLTPIRRVQRLLEQLGVDLRAKRGAAGNFAARATLTDLSVLLQTQRLDILLDVPASQRKNAADVLAKLQTSADALIEEIVNGQPFDAPTLGSVFPPKIVAMGDVLKDALAAKRFAALNYDGAFVYLCQFSCYRREIACGLTTVSECLSFFHDHHDEMYTASSVEALRKEALKYVADIEAIMLVNEPFPFSIPRRYASCV